MMGSRLLMRGASFSSGAMLLHPSGLHHMLGKKKSLHGASFKVSFGFVIKCGCIFTVRE